MDDERFTAEDAMAVVRHLQASSSAVLVGGQSLNYWAERFRGAVPELEKLVPFESRDVDFLGSVADAEKCARRLGGQLAYPSAEHVNTPEVGIVHCVVNGKRLKIDFLGFLAGLKTQQARKTAVAAQVGEGVVLRVLHPLDVLRSRLANIVQLRRRDELSFRQLRAAIFVAREFTRCAIDENPRAGLRLVEQMFEIAGSKHALKVWHAHQIDVAEAIAIHHGLPAAFGGTRLPQMRQRLAAAREKFAARQRAAKGWGRGGAGGI